MEMKKYKVNKGQNVNVRASKTGVKWKYAGKMTLEQVQEEISWFERNIEKNKEWRTAGHTATVSLKVTDAETGEVIYEKAI